MSKAKPTRPPRSVYRCTGCGHVEVKWLGKCPSCGAWSTLEEEVQTVAPARASTAGVADGGKPTPLDQLGEADKHPRLASNIAELDRVLGGGMVPGSLMLLGGDPGVGKSTLLLQALAGLSQHGHVLYATGEESVSQTGLRARRIGAAHGRISVVAETDIEKILGHAQAMRPSIVAIDSIQTVYTPLLDSIPGSLAQVRECTARLMQFAKTTHTPTILVGHVTKDGGLAGPKTLEHMVDVVLQFEGDAGPYRVLRSHKNRFGSTQEIGVFEMRGAGLAEVPNPSAHLLAERAAGAPGSVVAAAADGMRPLLVEVQALVAPAAAGFGRRTAAGVDSNRVALLLAVLGQRAACELADRDVFVNLAGGLRLGEPALDLALACAIASSARGRATDAHTVVFGEVGLAGEVRAVTLFEARLAEACRLGFRRAIVPTQNVVRFTASKQGAPPIEVAPVSRLGEALQLL